jgi:CRP/FNR family transcriptional regulator, cyclic AMP receptor protein
MNSIDLAGYVAASLVFLAFSMKGIIPLRIVALGSNISFLIYASGLHLMPIVILHLALIPVNCWRLWEVVRKDRPHVRYLTRS